MDILSLAIPLTAVLACSNLCAAAFARVPRFLLSAGTCLLALLAGDPSHHLVVFTHRSGFPFTDAASHQLGTVGFPNVDPLHEEVEHAHIAPVVIQLELAASEPGEQAGADVPAPLKRESVSIRDTIPMVRGLAIDGLHQQQFEIIGRSEI